MIDAVHGGDVYRIARETGRDLDGILDFSANINPAGPPAGVRALVRAYAADNRLTCYPEPGLPALTAALARRHGVGAEHVVIHGGSTALFDVILRACAPRRLGIVVPAFAEYERAAAANALAVRTFPLDARAATPFDTERFCRWVRAKDIDAVMLTNPHNPLGFALPATLMGVLRTRLAATLVVLDEAFADYDETLSIARAAATDDGLIVVRSLTKFYAIPDLRVGYAVMTAARARALARYLPAWPVSGIAAAAALAAISDPAYDRRTIAANIRRRTALSAALTRRGLRVLPGAANFVTVAVPGATALARRLLVDHAIVVRDCSSFAGLDADAYLRFAVRGERDNARLLDALDAELKT